MTETLDLRKTVLFERHQGLGAKTADFGGWLMPIEYAGGGVLKEHQAVRESVGLFDVSHMGTLTVTGPGAATFLDSCLTNSLDRIGPGRAQYTLCCNSDGGVVDDLIIYQWGPDGVLLVPNASNTDQVRALLEQALPEGISLTDMQDQTAILAVQGPRSALVLASLELNGDLDYMSFEQTTWRGHPVTVCRTGYTGEHGYELMIPNAGAGALWDALLEQVSAQGGRAAGLGARDSLRTEMGYPLHGHELSPQISPVQAGLGWAVGWDKPQFWGREALIAQKAAGPTHRARGLLAQGRGVPRADMNVRSSTGEDLGVTTSGTFSPTLGQGIALALLDPSVPLDAEVSIDVRGRTLAARVVRPPFVKTSPRAD